MSRYERFAWHAAFGVVLGILAGIIFGNVINQLPVHKQFMEQYHELKSPERR